MDRPSVFQVAEHGHVEVVEPSHLLADGEAVEEGLGRVLAGAVSGVDDRLARIFGREGRRADLGVADDDHVHVTGQRPDGVGQALALATEEYLTSLMGMTAPPTAAWRP